MKLFNSLSDVISGLIANAFPPKKRRRSSSTPATSACVQLDKRVMLAAEPILITGGAYGVEYAYKSGFMSVGSVVQGKGMVTRTVTIKNMTASPFALGNASITGNQDFVLIRNFNMDVLAPGQEASVEVGLRSDTLGYKDGAKLGLGKSRLGLELRGAVTSGGIVIDDGDAGFSKTGTWTLAPGYGAYRLRAIGGEKAVTATATWRFTDLKPGTYNVDASWMGYGNSAGSVPFEIRDGSATGHLLATRNVNQTANPRIVDPIVGGPPFGRLAQVTTTTGRIVVVMTNKGASSKTYVNADAVQVVPVNGGVSGASQVKASVDLATAVEPFGFGNPTTKKLPSLLD